MSLLTFPAAFQAWQTPASALHTHTCFLIPEARACSTTKRKYSTPRVLKVALWFSPNFFYLSAYAESLYA